MKMSSDCIVSNVTHYFWHNYHEIDLVSVSGTRGQVRSMASLTSRMGIRTRHSSGLHKRSQSAGIKSTISGARLMVTTNNTSSFLMNTWRRQMSATASSQPGQVNPSVKALTVARH